ncbi:hypothetical protein BHE74_00045010, partial [Ensete ventricosum]
ASRALNITLLPFLIKIQIILQTLEYKNNNVNNNMAHIRSTCGTIKCICANIKQYDAI